MNIVEHFFLGWCIASLSPQLSRRERIMVTTAAVIPDLDGLGLLVEIPTRHSANPILWWTDYHHILAHNVGFALVVAVAAFVFSRHRAQTTLLTILAFHSHILGDLVGARGPDGYQWPIPYFLPFSRTPELVWDGQWALNAWQNFLITGVLLAITFALAWRRGISPLEMVSARADAELVRTLRARFGTP